MRKKTTKVVECLNNFYESTDKYQSKGQFVVSPSSVIHSNTHILFHSRENDRYKSKSKTPKKGNKPQGLMEKHILERIQVYKKMHRQKKIEMEKLRHNALNEQQNINPVPQINKKSKQLYQRRKTKRNLSPNVFERLHHYDEQKSKNKLIKTITRIRQVTPTKRITERDLNQFATPKQIKHLSKLFRTEPQN